MRVARKTPSPSHWLAAPGILAQHRQQARAIGVIGRYRQAFEGTSAQCKPRTCSKSSLEPGHHLSGKFQNAVMLRRFRLKGLPSIHHANWR